MEFDEDRFSRRTVADTVRETLVNDIFRKCVSSGTFILVMDQRTMPVLQV